ETFDIVGVRGELAQGQLATLRSRDGTYVRATADGVLSGRSHSLGDPELFAVQKSGTGPLALGELTCFRATSGKLVNAIGGGGGAMGATATACTGAEPIFRAVRSFPNISRGKYAQQSSDYGNVCNPTASKAIDGNRDSNWSACSVSSTNQDDRAYWQVDLLGTYDLKRIAIYNRTDCCSDRLQDFEVKTSLDGTSWSTMLNIPGEVGPLYQSDLGGTARFVRVELHRKNYLSLAEVEVFGLQVPNTPTLPRPSTSDASQSYVTDLVAVGGGSADIACPAGMVRIEQDLNEGAGGLFIYACVRYGARSEALANVGIDELYRENNSAQGRLDLNAGAGGRYLYFKLTPGPATTPIKDIAFTVWSTLPGAEGEICKWGNGWARAPNYPDPGIRQDVPAAAQGDLNLGAGGKYIYTCLLR
ncbi:MAG: discoidin domain-containing protein, partial [Myxococcota bacterium]